jgi:Carboxypeptidase regulatory-like domain
MQKATLLLLLFCIVGWSQTSTGSIRGTITDPAGAAVPDAKITATDVERGVNYPTSTDSAGRYIFPGLPPARYTLTVEAAGFEKATQAAFNLEVQQQATVDMALTVGTLSSSVEVSASAPLLNVTSASLGQVIENKLIQSVPNNGRNPLSLVLLAPGIVGSTGGVSFISNGVRNNSSEVLMDGSSLTSIEQNGGITDVKYTPTSDAVAEIKVQTNFFSAEYGNTGGTIINMVSKSGTNELHGVGYYYRRDASLNANNWFSNSRNSPLADSYRNWLGGTAGGPVYLPRLYNGKNRTFFFVDVDYYKQLTATTSTASVPTAKQLVGDFSDTRLANGNLVPIYDPYNLTTNASGARVRSPLPGNIIPSSRLNPIALNFDKYFPAPTSDGNAFTHANNWFAQGSTPANDHKIDAKIDHNISDKQRFSSRYSVDWSYSGVANLVGNQSFNGNPGTARSQNFIMDYTRTHNATTVFSGRASVLRVASVKDPLSTGFDATTLGLPAYMTANTGTKDFPNYSAQYRAMGVSGYAIIHRYETLYQYLGSMTKILGGHTLKTGLEFRKIQENYYQPNLPGGGFNFNRKQTGLNPLSSSSSQGDGLASALLGFGNSGTVSIDYPTAQSAGYAGAYINDDWRVSRKLTLNFGLRWDADIPRTDRFNRINWLDLSAPAPIADVPQVKAVFPNLLGLMRFASSSDRTPYNGDWKNFQPRFGFAYALNSKTSIRAAYGIFYTVSRHTVKGEVGTGFGFTDSSTPWTLDGGFTQYATFANPWPAGLTLPPGRNPSAFLGMDAGTPLPYDRNPQYQQWNFSLQREVPGHGVVEINYSASKGTRLYLGDTNDGVAQLNNLYPMYWSMGVDKLTSLVPNPFYGVITNPTATDYNQPTIQLNNLLRRYPEYAGVGGYRAEPNIGDSSYHSLQIKYEKRFSHGLSVIAHYTFSKMISDSDEAGSDVEGFAVAGSIQNLFNLRQERSVSGLNRPQRVVASFDYQLPLGRGRAFGKNMNRILDGVVGGWELSSIISAQSGAPLQITMANGNLWDGAVQRPNLIGNPSMPGSAFSRLNNYFNVNAFSSPDDYTYGSAPRYLTNYRGPALINEDATLSKNFNIREHKYVQLRLEAYAVSNSPQWGNPNTGYGSSTFGQITTAGGNRTLQVAAKFYY